MASLQDIDDLVSRYSTEYRIPKTEDRRPGLPKIHRSEIYSLFSDKTKVPNAKLHWPETWPNCGERGVYGIFSDDELLYVGKASLQELGYRIGLHNRPRKRLGYYTPAEIFWGEYSGALETGGAALITLIQDYR